jgi:hypothetical protein
MSCLIGILVAFSLLTTSSFADQAGELEPRTHGVGQEAILQPEGQPLDAEDASGLVCPLRQIRSGLHLLDQPGADAVLDPSMEAGLLLPATYSYVARAP